MKTISNLKQGLGGSLAALGLFLPILLDIEGLTYAGEIALGIFIMASVLWVSEAIPIWSTSLLVIFLQVVLLSDKSILLNSENLEGFTQPPFRTFYNSLAHPIIVLFLGGFFLAASAVKFGLDKNLTRIMLRIFGTKPSLVLLGLLLATAVLSAFMSNTATAAMMITVILPIISQLKSDDPLRYGVTLAIPCGANIGGIATPIGTPPNAVVLGALAKEGIQISFAQWMMLTVPLVIVALLITWRALLILFPAKTDRLELNLEGGWNKTRPALLTYAIFTLTILLWVTDKIHGVSSTVVAFLPIAAMSVLGIITKADLKHFSWDVLWLMAGGLSLGISMTYGPAEFLVGLVDWSVFSPVAMILTMGIIGYVLANLMSHTVSATLLVPIAISMGVSGVIGPDFNWVLLSVIIGVMVSFSMLLPISTPPNAVAMSTGMIETRHLFRAGLIVGVVGYILTALFGLLLWSTMLPMP